MTFEEYLNKFTEADWFSTIESLLPEIHEVDRNAMHVWFRFYPLELFRYLQSADDKEKALQGFAMQGNYKLKDQIDSSHHFLYGHRYWKVVKAAIEAESVVFESDNIDLAEEIRQLGRMIAEKVKADRSLITGITAVGLMTLVQVSLDDFKNAKGEVEKPKGLMAKSPNQIVNARAKDDSQGLLGFLKTVDKKFTIIYDETRDDGRFRIMNDAEIATGSAIDQSQNWKEQDERCIEGVIPVECRSASCGTCWIGVLGGQEKLSEVKPRERKAVKIFGYVQPEDEKPLLRLACQARAYGNATIIIPPWNAVFGKKVYNNVEDVELEPATTSARANREIVREAVKN